MVDTPKDRVLPKSRSAPREPGDFIVDSLTPVDNNVTHRSYGNSRAFGSAYHLFTFVIRNPYAASIQIQLRLEGPGNWWLSNPTGSTSVSFEVPFALDPGSLVLVLTGQATAEGEVTIIQERVGLGPDPEIMGGLTIRFGS
jgi:hypothetical protein